MVGGYKKIEDGVVGGYKKIEDKFIDTFLARIATGSAVFGAVGVMALHRIFAKPKHEKTPVREFFHVMVCVNI